MNIIEILLSKRRMLLTAAIILSLMGALAWKNMPRQEDPQMPDYWANVVAAFPGANAEQIERLLLEPLDEHLAEVEGLKHWNATAQSEQAFIHIEMQSTIEDVEEVWDDVEDALEEAEGEFPDGASIIDFDSELNDQDAAVLAITGSSDLLQMAEAAQQIKNRLLTLAEVSEVRLIADPEEQITITFNDDQVKRLGLTPEQMAVQLQARNTTLSGGAIKLEGRTVNLSPETEFPSIEALAITPIALPNGSQVPLNEIAEIYYGPQEPTRALMRYQGAMAVGVGVVPKKGIHLIDFGNHVREEVKRLETELAPLEIHEVAFLPDRVDSRLKQLGQSLLLGIFIVALVLLIAMGLRLGLVVAMVVPLVALASLGIFSAGGGVLHQISIAALVIALGMLVDNAIVVAENIQWRIDGGMPPHQAAITSIKELASPLASATATTLAAFVPMLINEGTTAEFTRALPIVIMLTLTMSYLFAIFVTPSLSELFLRKRKNAKSNDERTFSKRLAQTAIRRPFFVIASAIAVVTIAIMASSMVKKQFFPSSDRNQVLVEVRLPEGAHLDETSAICTNLERLLEGDPNVRAVSSFIGRSAPHFYYNLSQIPWRPHFAQVLVTTQDLGSIPPTIEKIRQHASNHLTEALIIPRKLEQGPPVETPIEVRIYGWDFDELDQAANMVLRELRSIPGAVDCRHDLSLGAPDLRFQIDDGAAARYGLSRATVATSLFGRTRGLPIGQFRAGDDPIPIVLRSQEGEHLAAEDLETLLVSTPTQGSVPLASVAGLDLRWRPAAIKHRNRQRVVHVSAQLAEGFSFSQVQQTLETRMATIELPGSTHFEFGGDAEGSGEANASMVNALPWGILLLFAILLAQFNSFRRVGIILVTVPLAATGVIPGLLLGGQPFGFMSFLGVIALVGVVVNNAIVLLDVIENQRNAGADLEHAISEAVQRRTRPIILTTATTVAGLTPLALSESSLWPPLALAMISGLIASTLLTLLVVPALYFLLFKPRNRKPLNLQPSAVRAMVLPILLCLPFALRAQEPSHQSKKEGQAIILPWQEILERAQTRQLVEATQDQARAAAFQAQGIRDSGLLPKISAQASATYTDPIAEIETPLGSFSIGEHRRYSGNVIVSQPLYDPTTRRLAASLDAGVDALRAQSDQDRLNVQTQAVDAMIQVAAIKARAEVNQAFIQSLTRQIEETRVKVELGRNLEADLLKVQLELDQAHREEYRLSQLEEVAKHSLGRAIGYSGQVTPTLEFPQGTLTLPPLEEAIQTAIQNRPELKALKAQSVAFAKQSKSIDSEKLPSLFLRGGWHLSDGEAFRTDSGFEGSLVVNWKVFDGGNRKARKAAADLESSSSMKRFHDAKLDIEMEIRSKFADFHVAKETRKVAERGVELATENLRVEQERHDAGRATTNDLLRAEAMKRQRDIDLVLSKLDIFRALLNIKLAMAIQ